MDLIAESKTMLAAIYDPPPIQPIWEWARDNIDFSRSQNYDTPLHVRFDPDFAVYMKAVLDWIQDYDTREIWIRKCSRAAASEHILVAMRWIIAEAPRPTYYMTADQLTAERFMDSRIKRGMNTCEKARQYYRTARVTEHDIRFPHMDMRISWPKAKGAFKQDGWAFIVADEFSTWDAFAAEMLRKRAGTYAFHKIVGLSSPDPKRKGADADPVIDEYLATDQCKWMMPDPATGNLFAWEFGGEKDAHGLKWPMDAKDAESGEWDMERVRNEAYYLTPDGTRIENSHRMEISRRGKWVGTKPDAPKHIHGIWIVGPMVPFVDGDFGTLAYRFLEAKRKNSLRAYFMENWADVGTALPNSQTTGSQALRRRERNYKMGECFDADVQILVPKESHRALFLTVDVQKYHLWWLTRWWTWHGGQVQSGLEGFGVAASFDDLGKIITACKPTRGGIDIHYEGRFTETAMFCAEWDLFAMMGDDNLKKDIDPRSGLNPEEGGRRTKADMTYDQLTWNSDVFRSMLLTAIEGDAEFQWYVPRMPPYEYVKQVTSTHKVDGIWVTKRGQPNDHGYDCECEQLVLARHEGLI